jgi:tetratricopeptide (TPR) repeat protein
VERRFAVHAGDNPQAVTSAGARPGSERHQRGAWRPVVALVALASMASVAEARPKRRDARAAFDRGVAAYQKGNYEAASEALARSFSLERDVDTMFAWAQSERKLEHCDKAIDLYERLLAFNLPVANKTAVEQKLDECRTVIAQQKRRPEPEPAGEPMPARPKPVEPTSEPGESTGRVADRTVAPVSPSDGGPALHARAWYTDPVALGFLGTGLAATGIGAGILVSARSLDSDANHAADYNEALDLNRKAKSRATIGLVTTGAGGALLIGGILWIALHRDTTESHPVTAWMAPGGGGVAFSGSF